MAGRIKKSKDTSAEEIQRSERRRMWEAISKQVKPGSLQGTGQDETAKRNGLLLAMNIIKEIGI